MKIFVAILIVVCATAAFADDDADWQEFKMKHGKAFLSKNTESKRKAAFKKHNKIYKELQALSDAGKIPYTVSLYEFHDMEHEDILATMTGLNVPEEEDTDTPVYRANVHARQSYPDSYDARNYTAFNSVRGQGKCGSCWAFSSINTLEVTYTKSKGVLVDLSEQQLVDCVYNRSGCDGGMMNAAFKYLALANGSVPESLYKYTGVYGTCQLLNSTNFTNSTNSTTVRVTGPIKIGNDTDSIKNAIMEYGSISVGVNATYWTYYSGGVFILNPALNQTVGGLNHAVNMIGWGSDPQAGPFWLIRNSWGKTWGEKGYIRISTDPLGTFKPNQSYGVQLA